MKKTILTFATILMGLMTNSVSAQNVLFGGGLAMTQELHVFKGGDETIDRPTILIDCGYITKDNLLVTLTMGIHQSEPTPEQYSITGGTFGDPRSGTYFQNDFFSVGAGIKLVGIKGVDVFILGEVGSLTRKYYPIYRDPMGILGGSDNRYITRTGDQETSMVMGGGVMVTYDKYYTKVSATDKSVGISVGVKL